MRTTAWLLLVFGILAGGGGASAGGPWDGRDWLAHRQDQRSGAWKYQDQPHVGATALAVLSYLTNGEGDPDGVKDNRHRPRIDRGLDFLHRCQGPAGRFRGTDIRQQAWATLALAEAGWIANDRRHRAAATRGLAALAALDPGDDPVAHALVVANLVSAGFDKRGAPAGLRERERRWLDARRDTDDPLAAATRVFSHMLLGDKPDAVRAKARTVSARPPEEDRNLTPLRTWFAAAGLFQVGGSEWKLWSAKLVAALRPERFARNPVGLAECYGPVGAVALRAMALSFYYRYDRVFGAGDGDVSAPRAGLSAGAPSVLPPHSARIRLSGDESLPLETVSARVRIEGFRARVRLALFFHLGGERMREGTFQVRLPDGASPHTLAFGAATKAAASIGARSARELDTAGNWPRTKHARMVERYRARRAYTTIVATRKDPALLEWKGGGVFSARVFPLEPGKLHQVVLSYDVDLAAHEGKLRFALALPAARRACDVRIGDRWESASTPHTFVAEQPEPDAVVLAGGGYSALRFRAELPEGDWRAVAAEVPGCTDVLVRGSTVRDGGAIVVAARGAATVGAAARVRLRRDDGAEHALHAPLPAGLASDLAARVYGELAVARLEPFAPGGKGVPEAYARHFRIVRKTCSLLMLESERDYERFGILPPAAQSGADEAVVAEQPVAAFLKDRPAPDRRTIWRHRFARTLAAKLRKPVLELLAHVPQNELPDPDGPLASGSYRGRARACEQAGQPHMGVVFATAAAARRPDVAHRLWMSIAVRSTTGFWSQRARAAVAGLLPAAELDVLVLLEWAHPEADVDLQVVDPYGATCDWERTRPASGGVLTDRRPGPRTYGGPEVYAVQHASPGEYVVRAALFHPRAGGATTARVTVVRNFGRSGQTARTEDVGLARRHDLKEALRFTIPKR